MQIAAQMSALGRRMYVQLRQFEGVAEPVVALLGRQGLRDLLAPPQARLAGVPIPKPHQPAPHVKRPERTKAAIRSMAAQRVGKADHAPTATRETQCASEHTQRLVKQQTS